MSKVALVGDVHGDWAWMKFCLWNAAQKGMDKIVQVGDFGIYQGSHGESFLKRTNKLAAELGIEVYVVPGNHEDWTYINDLHANGSKRDDGWTYLRVKNILMAPRGHRWEWEGVSWVALGGAPSIDRTWRQEADAYHPNAKNPLWDAGEMITPEDVALTVAGGYADVMVGHDAPFSPTIDHRIAQTQYMWEDRDLLYAAEGRALMDEAFRGVAPRTFLHGHYHFKVNDMIRRPNLTEIGPDTPDRDTWSHIFGLDCNTHYDSMGHYDLETKEAVHWDSLKYDLVKFFEWQNTPASRRESSSS